MILTTPTVQSATFAVKPFISTADISSAATALLAGRDLPQMALPAQFVGTTVTLKLYFLELTLQMCAIYDLEKLLYKTLTLQGIARPSSALYLHLHTHNLHMNLLHHLHQPPTHTGLFHQRNLSRTTVNIPFLQSRSIPDGLLQTTLASQLVKYVDLILLTSLPYAITTDSTVPTILDKLSS